MTCPRRSRTCTPGRSRRGASRATCRSRSSAPRAKKPPCIGTKSWGWSVWSSRSLLGTERRCYRCWISTPPSCPHLPKSPDGKPGRAAKLSTSPAPGDHFPGKEFHRAPDRGVVDQAPLIEVADKFFHRELLPEGLDPLHAAVR